MNGHSVVDAVVFSAVGAVFMGGCYLVWNKFIHHKPSPPTASMGIT